MSPGADCQGRCSRLISKDGELSVLQTFWPYQAGCVLIRDARACALHARIMTIHVRRCSVWLVWPLLCACQHLAALPVAALGLSTASVLAGAACTLPCAPSCPLLNHRTCVLAPCCRDHAQREAAELAAARSAVLHAEEQRAAAWAAAPQVGCSLVCWLRPGGMARPVRPKPLDEMLFAGLASPSRRLLRSLCPKQRVVVDTERPWTAASSTYYMPPGGQAGWCQQRSSCTACANAAAASM